jgi:2-isopropylmalate synthase
MSQKAGMPIEVCAFIGSQRDPAVHGGAGIWTLLLERSREALEFCRRSTTCTVMYVTEDTTRAHSADGAGAVLARRSSSARSGVCVCDTVGHSDAARRGYEVVQFVRGIVLQGIGMPRSEVGIDWHGHRDRGLALANCLAAVEAGATRDARRRAGHRRARGQRADGPAAGQLRADGLARPRPPRAAGVRPQTVAEAVGVQTVHNYPALGQDAFETGTGVHASAVIKAFRKGDVALADSVYSGVPAHMVGLEQRIGIGPMSGRSNVIWCLERLGIEPTDDNVQKVLAAAKGSKQLLSDEEIREAVGA